MRDDDIRVLSAAVEFRDVALEHPLGLAGGAITHFTLAVVEVDVVNRRGHRGTGQGTGLLSVPWSWPASHSTVIERDARLRGLVEHLADRAAALDFGDPFELWKELATVAEEGRAEGGNGDPVPALAAVLPLGAVDNAIHDAWARVAGRPAFALYTGEHLNGDLGTYLGSDFAGTWPGDALAQPRARLPVQHVVGTRDPLRAESTGGTRSLEEWARADQFRDVKIKLGGVDPAEDARRVAEVHKTMTAAVGPPLRLSVDPNEGYADMGGVVDFVGCLRATSPAALGALAYMEQPVPRDIDPEPAAMRSVGAAFPVLVDEGLARVDELGDVTAAGWHGLVVKAAKGQTSALLAHAYARHHGLFLVVQDLTAVDLALEHSARLAAHLNVSAPGFECNSRQYAPGANVQLAERRPELLDVIDGAVTVGSQHHPGLY